MKTKRFPLTIETTDGQTWTREANYQEGPGIRHNYVRYHSPAGVPAYSRGGRALYSLRFTDTDTHTVCQPGRKIADVIA